MKKLFIISILALAATVYTSGQTFKFTEVDGKTGPKAITGDCCGYPGVKYFTVTFTSTYIKLSHDVPKGYGNYYKINKVLNKLEFNGHVSIMYGCTNQKGQKCTVELRDAPYDGPKAWDMTVNFEDYDDPEYKLNLNTYLVFLLTKISD